MLFNFSICVENIYVNEIFTSYSEIYILPT